MATYLKAVRSLYIFPRKCDVCKITFDIGYAVISDDGTQGDVCGRCLKRS